MNLIHTRPIQRPAVTVLNILLGLFFSLSAMGQPAFITNGLIAYYPFNGNPNDESGNGKHGQVDGALLSRDRFGNDKSAFQFDGVNSRITVSNLKIDSPNISVSFWFKANQFDYKKGARFLSHNWDVTQPFGTFAVDYLYGGIFRGDQDSQQCGFYLKKPIPTNTWEHWVLTFNGTAANFYTNGVFAGSQFGPIRLRQTTGTLFIGGDWYVFDGVMDDVRIYNRALIGTEAQSLYLYESTPPDNRFLTNGLVAHYPFDGNANDYSGYSNNCLKNGSVSYSITNPSSLLVSNSGYVYATNTPQLNPSSEATFSVWIKSDEINPLYSIFSKATPDDSGSYMLSRNQINGGSFRPHVRTANGWRFGDVTFEIAKNSWIHFLYTFSSKSGMAAFVNGSKIQFANDINLPSIGETIIPSTSSLLFGADVRDTNISNLNGSLRGFRIYNRTLSGAEIKSLYTYEASSYIDPPVFLIQPQNQSINVGGGCNLLCFSQRRRRL